MCRKRPDPVVVTGRLALIAAVAAVVVATAAPNWYGVAIATGMIVISAVLDILMTRGHDLVLSRPPLTTVRLGRDATVELVVHNRATAPARGLLWDDWPMSAGQKSTAARKLALPPDSLVRLTATLAPTVRGNRVAGPVTVRLVGPLGLAGRQFRRDVTATVRALPAFRSERLLASRIVQLRHLEGRTVARLRGQGAEFDSVREYVAGDDVRSIDWRASARTSDVMVRMWRPERDRHVVMVLDTGRVCAARVGDTTRLEANMEAALLLGGLAAAAGDTVDLIAYDRRVRAELTGLAGKRLQPKLMHAMADIPAVLSDTDFAGMVRHVIRRASRRSLVVLFTELDPALIRKNVVPVLPVLARRHHVLVVSVADPDLGPAARARDDDVETVYTAAAAEEALAQRAVAREQLRAVGVGVVSAGPDDLPTALADEYLNLKRTGTM